MCKKSRCLRFIENLAPNTQKSYRQAIKRYEEFHGTSMEDMVMEALDEQTNQVPPHLLKIIDRIESFQFDLCNKGMVYGSIMTLVGKIKTIYKRNRVVIPYIEPLNPKQVKRREYIEFKDVLTKDELRDSLEYMRLPAKARALTIIQGGLSNEECEHLSLKAFIDELKPYHQKDDMIEALEWLSDENHPVIWVTKLIRWKTKKPYYCCIGAEAVNMIATAKLYEMKLPKYKATDKLLNTNKDGFGYTLRMVNDKLGLGRVAEESKLRPHNLRRFHATYIKGSVLSYEERSLTNYDIDEMQGRGKTSVQDTYIKTNPLEQKLLYAKVMNNLSLWHKYNYQIIDGDVIITIDDPNKENKKLREEVKELSHKLSQKQRNSEKLNALRNELGDDVFKELVMGILDAD